MGGRGRGRGHGVYTVKAHTPPMQAYRVSNEIENINMQLELLCKKKRMIQNHMAQEGFANVNQYDGRYNAMPPSQYEAVMFESPGPSQNYFRIQETPFLTHDNRPHIRGKKRRAGDWVVSTSKRLVAADNSMIQFGTILQPLPQPVPFNTRPSKSQRKRPPIPKTKEARDDALTVRPDREPSPLLRERLRTALNMILNKMKESFADEEKFYTMLFVHPYLNNIKLELRKRITAVMMNKTVDKLEDVEKFYRLRHPIESDVAFLKRISKEVGSQTSKPDILSDFVVSAPMNPGPYRNTELPFLIDNEVDEVFRKLEIMYNPKLSDAQKERKLADKPLPIKCIEEFIPEEERTEEINLWKMDVREKIHKMVPTILLKNVNHITKLLKMDLIYVNTCTNVVNQTNEKGGTDLVNMVVNENTGGMPKYCARIRGQPKLPVTTVMRPFLNEFNPVWVKKNRVVRNVLFVAFRDEESLERMLEKDGFDFGSCFLRISRIMNNRKKGKANARVRKDSYYDLNEHEVSGNLNDQIQELLQSFKNTQGNENEIVIEDSDSEHDCLKEVFLEYSNRLLEAENEKNKAIQNKECEVESDPTKPDSQYDEEQENKEQNEAVALNDEDSSEVKEVGETSNNEANGEAETTVQEEHEEPETTVQADKPIGNEENSNSV